MPTPRTPVLLCASLAIAALAEQARAQAPSRSEAFALPEITSRLAASNQAWNQFLTRDSLSCGVYRLAAGAADRQSPHDRDEVYHVVAGRAKLEVEGTTHEASAGKVLFVAAGARHRFVDIEEDLVALVFFSEVRGTRGGMAAGPRPTKQTPYDEASERGSARVFYWFGDASAGQAEIAYGRPAWKPAYERFLSQPGDTRWRLGENFWTTLDTNVPIAISGVELAAGQYYLVLENHAEEGPRILALDPAEIRTRRLDAYEADETRGGIALPLKQSAGAGHAARLSIDLTVDRAREHHGKLRVRFGPHLLEADFVMKP